MIMEVGRWVSGPNGAPITAAEFAPYLIHDSRNGSI
jgi:hypothetical protein